MKKMTIIFIKRIGICELKKRKDNVMLIKYIHAYLLLFKCVEKDFYFG